MYYEMMICSIYLKAHPYFDKLLYFLLDRLWNYQMNTNTKETYLKKNLNDFFFKLKLNYLQNAHELIVF